jgi:hypothetical protein
MGLRNRIADAVNSRFDIFSAILQTSLALEHLFHESIGVDAATRNYLDREIGSHPASYNRDSVRDEAELYRLFALPIDALIDSVIAERGGLRAIANLNFIADRRVEVLAHALECHPTAIDECRRRLDLLPPEELTRSAEELVSYLVGVAFGRWDARIARDLSLAPPQTGLFDPVPLCPPGMLVGNDGLPARKAPQGYPFELPPDWLLLDEPGHEWDIEAAVGQAAAELLDDPESILAEVEGILGYRSLRDYLRKQFFKDHLGRYTKSRRKAPIYWYLSVLSREWGVWVYAPTLSRETLYAVASHAARRQAAGRERVEALRAERDAGGRGRSAREVLKHLEGEEDLVKELEVFRAEAERIARLGWEPDLDDGIILCAAPLATLFPAWRLAAEERAKLRNGVYPWASVSRWGKRL